MTSRLFYDRGLSCDTESFDFSGTLGTASPTVFNDKHDTQTRNIIHVVEYFVICKAQVMVSKPQIIK